MSSTVLLDTHCWAWSLLDRPMPVRVVDAIRSAASIAVSPISVFEIAQKVHLGKCSEMERLLPELTRAVSYQNAVWADLTPEVAQLAGHLDWPHRDPFDRLLAATALVNGCPLISADTAFDTLIGLRRIW